MIFKDLINEFGIPLEITIKNGGRDEYGVYHENLSDKPISVVEPLVPKETTASSTDGAEFYQNSSGGTYEEANVRWFSLYDVPLKTLVKDLSSGKNYQVINKTSWLGYADVVEYQLKEFDHNQRMISNG